MQAWANGNFSAESGDASLQKNAEAIGVANAYRFVIEEITDEEEA
jgi:hypothetical protein